VTGPDSYSEQDQAFTEDTTDSTKGSWDSGDPASLTAGGYNVSEDAVTGDVAYTVAYGGDCDSNGDVSLALGETKTCTVTNTASKADPTLATVQSWTLHDDVTFTGLRPGAASADTVEVTFSLYSDDTCETLVDSESVVLGTDGYAETANGVDVTDSGTYYWQVSYPGDEFNNEKTTTCGDEVTQILAKDAKGEGGRDDFVTP
jgi:hypothetical protein